MRYPYLNPILALATGLLGACASSQTPAQNASATSAEPCAAADVDGDDDLDLIVPHWAEQEDTIVVLYNDGTGHFPVSAWYVVGSRPRTVAAGDLNGDGWVDATDMAMAMLGGDLKRKEALTGRFADVFSWLYLGNAVLRRFEAEGCRKEDLPYLHWSMQTCLAEIQKGFDGIFSNFNVPLLGWFFRGPIALWSRFNVMSTGPNDRMMQRVARATGTTLNLGFGPQAAPLAPAAAEDLLEVNIGAAPTAEPAGRPEAEPTPRPARRKRRTRSRAWDALLNRKAA